MPKERRDQNGFLHITPTPLEERVENLERNVEDLKSENKYLKERLNILIKGLKQQFIEEGE